MFKASLREGTRPHAIKAFQSAGGGGAALGAVRGAQRARCGEERSRGGRLRALLLNREREKSCGLHYKNKNTTQSGGGEEVGGVRRRAAACPQALLGRPPRRSEQAGAAARLRPALSARPRPGGAEAPRGAAHPARPGAP